jgi:hypothetical protein
LVFVAVHSVPVETLVLVLVPVGQQGLPGPPHAPVLQDPPLQVPGIGMQLLPLATQRFWTQQPSLLQVLPEQHSCPGPPHATLGTTPPLPPEPPLPPPLPPAPPLLPPLPPPVFSLPPPPKPPPLPPVKS